MDRASRPPPRRAGSTTPLARAPRRRACRAAALPSATGSRHRLERPRCNATAPLATSAGIGGPAQGEWGGRAMRGAAESGAVRGWPRRRAAAVASAPGRRKLERVPTPPTPPMTHVFHRHLRRTPPVAVSGHGCTIVDAAGKEYLDACGGAAVSCLGHGHPDVLAAMHAQIDALAYAHTSFFTTEAAEALADQLVRTAPAGISHAYFVSGGSEAMEAALKMARQYFVEIGQPQRGTLHRPPAELPRQHAGRAGRRRQRVAAPAVRAAADRRHARRAVLRLPRHERRRDAGSLRPAARRRARRRDPRASGPTR